MRHHPGKALAGDDAALASQDCGVEDLLNQTRFFSQWSQMVEYCRNLDRDGDLKWEIKKNDLKTERRSCRHSLL